MYRLLLTSLICLGLLAPASASAWWQDDWQYRKQVSVDTTPQGAAINDSLGRLPLLVRLHTGNFTFDGVNENGSTSASSPPTTRPCCATRSRASTR